MVCIFLHGGLDSFNTLVPTDSSAYADYQAARGGLAINSGSLLGISDPTDGRSYGLHPALSELHQLYSSGSLAFVPNVGALIQPTTTSGYSAGTNLPLGLFSHSDQQRHWQTSIPQSRTQLNGWVGRMADVLTDSVNANPSVSLNIALGSTNVLQTGSDVIPYVVDAVGGAELLKGYGSSSGADQILTMATDSLLNQTYSDLLKRTHARYRRESLDAAIQYKQATSAVNLNTAFPNSGLGRSLQQAAKAIGARGALGQSRQTFFIGVGGWDHHASLLSQQAAMLPALSKAMKAFYDATVELGVSSDVATFTCSDFGRTLSSNGDGSDHAWGGNHMVMGDSVAGGQLHGAFPTSLAPGNSLDIGRGRILPTLSTDEYSADLAMWFGIGNDTNLEEILPNIRNFYSSSASAPPVGIFV